MRYGTEAAKAPWPRKESRKDNHFNTVCTTVGHAVDIQEHVPPLLCACTSIDSLTNAAPIAVSLTALNPRRCKANTKASTPSPNSLAADGARLQ
jgi:hypothetical protein